jgi:hypothetical protein
MKNNLRERERGSVPNEKNHRKFVEMIKIN